MHQSDLCNNGEALKIKKIKFKYNCGQQMYNVIESFINMHVGILCGISNHIYFK